MTETQTATEHDTASIIDRSEQLRIFIATHRAEAEFVEPGVPMPTVPLAAAAIGVTDDDIIKSVLFCDSDGECVLAIASGTARIDRQRLAKVTDRSKLRLADPDTVIRVTGFPAGGVSPIGHASPVAVVIDQRAATRSVVYGGGGAEHLLLRITPGEIVRLTGATIAEITQNT